MAEKEKTKAEKIAELKKKCEKDYGEGTIIGATEKPMKIDVISTGSIGLDKALGIGGLPRGRVVEAIGWESSGKTTLAEHVIAEAQKLDKEVYCGYVDVEHALDTGYAQAIGVNLEKLDISQPSWGEQALEVADRMIESGLYDVVVIDSVAALVPKAEQEGQVGENKMGVQARLMGQALRKITPNAAKTNTLVIFINQIREKIGVMYGSPDTTPGGNAMKFFASIRLDIRRSLTEENSVFNGTGKDKEKVGNQVVIKVTKNKLAPPFKKAEIDILYGIGFDKIGEVIDLGKKAGVLRVRKEKEIPYVTYKDMKVTEEEFREMLMANEEFMDEIRKKLLDAEEGAEGEAIPE